MFEILDAYDGWNLFWVYFHFNSPRRFTSLLPFLHIKPHINININVAVL